MISASSGDTQIEIMESEVHGDISINNLEGTNSVYVWRGNSKKISVFDCVEMSIVLFHTNSDMLSLLRVSGVVAKVENCIISESVKIDECILKQLTFADMFQVPQVLFRDLSVDSFKLERISSNNLFEIHSMLPGNVNWILSDLKNLKIISCDWGNSEFVCDRTIFAPVSYSDFIFPNVSKVNEVGLSSESTRKASVFAQFAASAKAQRDQRMEMRFKSKTQNALLLALRSDLKEELPEFYINLSDKNKTIIIKAWEKGLYLLAINRRDWWNVVQLYTNRLTNRFGLSYRRSLAWFVVLSLVFFGGYICAVDENLHFTLSPFDWYSGIEHIWAEHKQQYFYFINPVRRTGFLCANFDCGKVHWSAGLWDFASRIILVYLSYQFVQAFRKWGR